MVGDGRVIVKMRQLVRLDKIKLVTVRNTVYGWEEDVFERRSKMK